MVSAVRTSQCAQCIVVSFQGTPSLVTTLSGDFQVVASDSGVCVIRAAPTERPGDGLDRVAKAFYRKPEEPTALIFLPPPTPPHRRRPTSARTLLQEQPASRISALKDAVGSASLPLRAPVSFAEARSPKARDGGNSARPRVDTHICRARNVDLSSPKQFKVLRCPCFSSPFRQAQRAAQNWHQSWLCCNVALVNVVT